MADAIKQELGNQPVEPAVPNTLFSEDFHKLEAAEQAVVESVELASEALAELCKVGRADAEKVAAVATKFLQNVKDVQATLVESIGRYATTKPYECSDYDLYLEGFTKITNVDLSPVVIERMKAQAQAAQQTEMQWRVADMLDLPFADATFDVVLEKGTMDVLFVDNDSPWDPLPEVKQRVVQMLAETHRVLSPHGCFVSITFAQPHFRRPFLLAPQFSWSMKYDTFGETFHYFVYTMEKGARTEADLLENQPGYTATAPHLTESMLHEHMDEEDYLLHMQL
ncbi:hypothetical protein WJX72_005851 [[Myrmecia] bisecta]|uniref:Methyltransferase type 11 domain-containing protein n=1 Tax=[Myrmecia] bisecta TaxID=41462 RepID=A0AAW1PLM9_9CHLO